MAVDRDQEQNPHAAVNPASPPQPRIVSIMTTSERGGAEYASVDLLAALRARGHDVAFLTNAPHLVAGTGVPARTIDIGPKLARRSALQLTLRSPLILLRLARALRAERPVGALLVHFKKEQLLCSLLPRRLTSTIVWAEWGPVPASMRRGPGRLLYALAVRRAHRILAVSKGTAQTVSEAGAASEKIVVLPDLVNLHAVEFDREGRDTLRRDWGADEQTLVVGCISRFQKRKRNDVVIDAMQYLDSSVLLVISGEGKEESALRERAAGYGDRVRFTPNVRGYVEQFLSACDVLAFAPSATEADRPRVIVMAALVGLPVIATHSEGAEALKPPGAGIIIDPCNDPRALADAIKTYLDDPERRRHDGATLHRAMIATYDPGRTVRAVESLLGLGK